jgi:hypothetical protein
LVQKESVVTPERFSAGMSWGQYLGSIQKNVERFRANYEGTVVSDDDARFFREAGARPNGPKKVLALGEDWCPDVYRGLGVIARVAEALGAELRIFPRDANLDIMDEFLNDGQFQSIPVAVFYTDNLRELGRWIERPVLANEEHHLIDEIFAEGKPREQQRAEYAEFQAGPTWATWRAESVREMRELLERAVG